MLTEQEFEYLSLELNTLQNNQQEFEKMLSSKAIKYKNFNNLMSKFITTKLSAKLKEYPQTDYLKSISVINGPTNIKINIEADIKTKIILKLLLDTQNPFIELKEEKSSSLNTKLEELFNKDYVLKENSNNSESADIRTKKIIQESLFSADSFFKTLYKLNCAPSFFNCIVSGKVLSSDTTKNIYPKYINTEDVLNKLKLGIEEFSITIPKIQVCNYRIPLHINNFEKSQCNIYDKLFFVLDNINEFHNKFQEILIYYQLLSKNLWCNNGTIPSRYFSLISNGEFCSLSLDKRKNIIKNYILLLIRIDNILEVSNNIYGHDDNSYNPYRAIPGTDQNFSINNNSMRINNISNYFLNQLDKNKILEENINTENIYKNDITQLITTFN